MTRLRGADEIIIRQLQFFHEGLPVGGESIAVFLRILFLGLRGLLDFLTVLVQTGQKENFLTKAPPRPRDDVGNDLLVGVAEMRLAVDVINRGGDVKPFAHR